MSWSPPPPQGEVPLDAGSLTRIAARVFDTPLLIAEGKLSQILAVLGPRLGFDLAAPLDAPPAGTPATHSLASGAKWEWNDLGYYNVGAAAVVPVVGTLVQRSAFLDSLSGFLSYDKIERRLAAAVDDRNVEEIVVDYDSPGGEAAGAFDVADRLLEFRAAHTGKPVTAVVNELAASAGYLLASTADEIVIPRTGVAGSIGVVGAHVDQSAAMEKRGIAVTFLYAGDKKVDGNPYQPLSERARADWQAEIDAQYDIFVATVARNRGISEASVRETQAGLYMGDKAVRAGLADRIGALKTELAVIESKRRRGGYSFTASTEIQMTAAEKEERDKAVAEAREEGLAQGKAQAKEEAEAAGKAAAAESVAKAKAEERERIKAIVTSDEAKQRADMAAHLAFETDTTAEAAVKLLAVAPKQDAKTPLAAAMAQIGTPGIRSTEASDDAGKPAQIDRVDIYAKANAAYFATIGGSKH